MSRPTTPRRALAALVVATAVAGACSGVPVDEKPEAISRAELPDQLLPSSTSTTLPSDEADQVFVYLVRGDGTGEEILVPTLVDIPTVDPENLPAAVLQHLIGNEPTEQHQNQGLGSDIPGTVTLLDVRQDGDVVTVDLSGLEAVESTKQKLAVAQLVFTLTTLGDIDAVIILSDGQPRSLSIDAGSSEPGEALNPDDHFPTLKGKLTQQAASTTTTVLVQPSTDTTP